MKNTNPERSEIVAEKDKRHDNNENRTRILVVDGHPAVRHGLKQLFDKEADLGVCVEAENVQEALEAIEKRQIDLAVIDIYSATETSVELAQTIRFKHPNLPLLTLSIDSSLINRQPAFSVGTSEYLLNKESIEKIVAAVKYIKCLLHSRFFGFSVFVKV